MSDDARQDDASPLTLDAVREARDAMPYCEPNAYSDYARALHVRLCEMWEAATPSQREHASRVWHAALEREARRRRSEGGAPGEGEAAGV